MTCRFHLLKYFEYFSFFVYKKCTSSYSHVFTARGKVSSAVAYQRIFPVLLEQAEKEPLSIARELNLLQTSDERFIEQLIDQAIAKYPDKATAYRKGKKNLLGLFMGEVMRHSEGKADPKVTNNLLRRKLEDPSRD